MKTSNGFLYSKCQVERSDQILVFQARDELAYLPLLWVFGGEQAMQPLTNLPVVFTERRFERIHLDASAEYRRLQAFPGEPGDARQQRHSADGGQGSEEVHGERQT